MRNRMLSMVIAVAAGLAGCGDDDGSADAGSNDGSLPTDSGAGDDGGPDAGATDGGVEGPRVVAAFDGASFELPESLAYHAGQAYLSFLNGSVVTVDPEGTVTHFGAVAIDPPGSAYALGIAVAGDGTVFVAMALASATSTFAAGVYRIAPEGGAGVLFASHAELAIPNDIAVGADGSLYVTADGRIYRVTDAAPGIAEIWSEDALLASSDGTAGAPCGVRTSPFPIGANGIDVEDDRVVAANTESASIVAIAIEADGSAGAITTIVTDTSALCGVDGLVGDADGYLATALGTSLVRIARDGASIAAVHAGLPFRSPAGVDVGVFGGSRHALVSNPDFEAAFGAAGPASAMPNLTAVPL